MKDGKRMKRKWETETNGNMDRTKRLQEKKQRSKEIKLSFRLIHTTHSKHIDTKRLLKRKTDEIK